MARAEIFNYLGLKNTGYADAEIYLPEDEQEYLRSTDHKPATDLFCFNGASGEKDGCTPADFERDFLQKKEDGQGTLFSSNNLETICSTPQDVCVQKINDAKYIKEE